MLPPRLHVLLARDARTAVVLRRGPSKTACAIGWDRRRDTFAVGQWLRARVYERRSDLSPDGRYLIYFAMNGRWDSATQGAWTAISRAPNFAAVALFGKGDCWHGGGLFATKREYWLNDGYGHHTLGDTTLVSRANPAPFRATWGGECWGVYFNRLARDGWTMHRDLSIETPGARTIVFERPIGHGWRLRKLAHASSGSKPPGKGVYYDEHELVHDRREVPRPAWEWADIDGKRLIWAEHGALWAGSISARSARGDDPVAGVERLHDFSEMTFTPIAAPYPHVIV
ncbi:MAG TPA: hypothetical protein VGF94_19070 [Kofleriaceae bacterium]|jgi:hypothetical protein